MADEICFGEVEGRAFGDELGRATLASLLQARGIATLPPLPAVETKEARIVTEKREKAQAHLDAGARTVVISAVATDAPTDSD